MAQCRARLRRCAVRRDRHRGFLAAGRQLSELGEIVQEALRQRSPCPNDASGRFLFDRYNAIPAGSGSGLENRRFLVDYMALRGGDSATGGRDGGASGAYPRAGHAAPAERQCQPWMNCIGVPRGSG